MSDESDSNLTSAMDQLNMEENDPPPIRTIQPTHPIQSLQPIQPMQSMQAPNIRPIRALQPVLSPVPVVRASLPTPWGPMFYGPATQNVYTHRPFHPIGPPQRFGYTMPPFDISKLSWMQHTDNPLAIQELITPVFLTGFEPLTYTMMVNLPMDVLNDMLYQRLCSLVQPMYPALADRIVGIIMSAPCWDIYYLLKNHDFLQQKVQEISEYLLWQ